MDAERWQRLKQIYSAALDRPEAERNAYISEACSGDPDLAEEVQKLLGSRADDDFLENPSGLISQIIPVSNRPRFEPGETLAHRFVIQRFIARGGMGEVYAAFDSELEEAVALKTVRPEIAVVPHAIQQFKQEVSRARSIASEYVCRVYDLFTHEAGEGLGSVHFLTMELLVGETLYDRLNRRGAFEVADGADVVKRIGEGLAAAHKEGIVHGDLKLSNVMLVRREDGALVPKITDFGLARQAAGTDGGMRGAGTPDFMAPEQLAGANISNATDLYALGLIATHVFTGLARPSDPKAILSTLGGLPRPARRALAACLDADARKRPSSAMAVAEALKLERARATRRYVLSALCAGAGAVAISTQVSPVREWLAVPRRTGPRIAVVPFSGSADGLPYFSAAITEELSTALARNSSLAVVGRDTMERFRDTKLRPSQVAAQVGATHVLTGSFERGGGHVRVRMSLAGVRDSKVWSQVYQGNETRVLRFRDDAAADIARHLRVRATPASLRTEEIPASLDVHEAFWKGRFHLRTRTDAGVRSSIPYFEQVIASNPRFADAYAGLSDAHSILAERGLAPAGHALSEAKRFAKKALSIDSGVAHAWVSLAHVTSLYDRDYRNAESLFRRALSLEPASPAARQWYSYLLTKLRRFDESREHALKALEVDPLSVPANANLAVGSYYAERFDDCVAQCRKLMELQSNLVWTRMMIALVFARKGLRSEALREMEHAPDHPLALRTKAELHGIFGEHDIARAAADELAQRRAKGGVPASWVAAAMAASGQKDAAFDWMERAYAEHDAFLTLVDVYPAYGSVRSDPRYRTLVAKLGLRS